MSAEKPKRPFIVNLNEVETLHEERGKKFAYKRKRLGAAAGSVGLGCSWYEIPPAKQPFPHHFHCGTEEAFYILSGNGEFRYGEKKYEVQGGDYVAVPTGPEGSHSVMNTGKEPLVYLALSTINTLDIVVYPDSKKVAFAGAVDPKKGLRSAAIMKIVKTDAPSLDYYQDEEGA